MNMTDRQPSQFNIDARRQELVSGVKRIVVKVGSAVIAGNGRLRPKVIADLAYDVSVLLHQGFEVVMVVSGAVAAGYSGLRYKSLPSAVVKRQASASVGQYKLMTLFAKAFNRHRVEVAQLLMMEDDFSNPRRFLSARHTLQELIGGGVVPIINENDALAEDEKQIGDNDHLAAWVTNVASADLLVLLSSVPGVYQNGSDGAIVDEVQGDVSLDGCVTAEISATGVGGMKVKVSAARLANSWGVPAIIADGKTQGVLGAVVKGGLLGTVFRPTQTEQRLEARWMAVQQEARGVVGVSDRGRDAVSGGRGLSPEDVVSVDGTFGIGDRVDLSDDSGCVFATGLVSYDSSSVAKMCGKSSAEFQQTLGYSYIDDIVHADDIVLQAAVGLVVRAAV
ncbi:MAG: glutamate 5-kinase [Phycisphaerae bacterium]|nr:MAG: glutamate 5-kinase [Phycisphaerae bacterium]